MKHFYLLTFTCLFLLGGNLQAQNFKLSRYIMATDTITDEGVTFAASSDDAEQENDAMDALFDDDIDCGWEGEPGDFNILTAGMRFRNIFIPKGATIDSAFVIVHSHEAKTADDVANITIVGEATDNAQTFTEDQLITDRPQTMASIRWIVNEPWGLWTPHRTPDVKDIVQEIVNRDGWVAGNALSLIFLGEDQGPSEVENAREWQSFENIADPEDGGDGQNYPERVPELVVYYTVQSGMFSTRIKPTGMVEDEGVSFEASSDDAEQENDAIDALFDDDIDCGWEGEPGDFNILTAGMRFRDIAVPQGAVIDSAYIRVWSHEAKTAEDVANITIYGDATDDAQTFTEDQLITDRPATDATVRWVVDEPWGLWTPHTTPDLSAIVQEIVDRDGWETGNSIAFILAGEDQGPSEVENAREWQSFENIADPEDGGDGQNYPERVPQLVIYYSSANAVTSVINRQSIDIQTLQVFPNPTSGALNIVLDNAELTDIQIFDVNGQLMQQYRQQQGPNVRLSTAGLNAGVYFIMAKQKEAAYVQKFVVKK